MTFMLWHQRLNYAHSLSRRTALSMRCVDEMGGIGRKAMPKIFYDVHDLLCMCP